MVVVAACCQRVCENLAGTLRSASCVWGESNCLLPNFINFSLAAASTLPHFVFGFFSPFFYFLLFNFSGQETFFVPFFCFLPFVGAAKVSVKRSLGQFQLLSLF